MIKTQKLILTYHDVESAKYPKVVGSYPISMKRFKKQIQLLKSKGFIFDYISNLTKKNNHERICYITADDGLTDWTKNVLPWCEKEKIPTHNAIITGPLEDKRVYPLAHIIQVKLVQDTEKNLNNLCRFLKNDILSDAELSYINKIYFYEKIEYRRIIKGAFNLVLDTKKAYKILGDLSGTVLKHLQCRFENLNYYKQFKYTECGVHGRTHCALEHDTSAYIKNEIISCQNFLKKNNIAPSKYYTLPMRPKYNSTVEDLIKPLTKLGFSGIFAEQGCWNQKDFIIRRIDAKNVENFVNENY